MGAQGNIIMFFGAFVFYSFIIWGIGSLYDHSDDPRLGIQYQTYLDFSKIDKPVNSGNRVLDFASGIGDWLITLVGFFANVFLMASYQDPRIPPIVTTLVIMPINISLLYVLISLIRGGGS